MHGQKNIKLCNTGVPQGATVYTYVYGILTYYGSLVGIATCYSLDVPGIESRWLRDFPHLSRPV